MTLRQSQGVFEIFFRGFGRVSPQLRSSSAFGFSSGTEPSRMALIQVVASVNRFRLQPRRNAA